MEACNQKLLHIASTASNGTQTYRHTHTHLLYIEITVRVEHMTVTNLVSIAFGRKYSWPGLVFYINTFQFNSNYRQLNEMLYHGEERTDAE